MADVFISHSSKDKELPWTFRRVWFVLRNLLFLNARILQSYVIPNSVEQIAGNAFDGSDNLTLIYRGHRYSYEERHSIPVMEEVTE